MGNVTTLDRHGINGVLKNGNPRWPYYPLNDPQSRDLFLLRREQLGDDGFKLYEKVYEEPVVHISRVGYYHGEVVAFRFENSHRPFLFFQHRNENFKEIWRIIKSSYKKRSMKESSHPINITFYKNRESDFYWVSSVNTNIEINDLHRGNLDLKTDA